MQGSHQIGLQTTSRLGPRPAGSGLPALLAWGQTPSAWARAERWTMRWAVRRSLARRSARLAARQTSQLALPVGPLALKRTQMALRPITAQPLALESSEPDTDPKPGRPSARAQAWALGKWMHSNHGARPPQPQAGAPSLAQARRPEAQRPEAQSAADWRCLGCNLRGWPGNLAMALGSRV